MKVFYLLVNEEWTLRQGPAKPKNSKFSFTFCVLYDRNIAWNGFLTKYLEFDFNSVTIFESGTSSGQELILKVDFTQNFTMLLYKKGVIFIF